MPPEYYEAAPRRGHDVHEMLEREAAQLRPGESGLLALDWWNGNRSVLVDADLRGLLVGMTLATKAPEIYRALIEATAFGTRVIVDAFESAGVPRRRDRRLRRPARAEQAADADLRRRHGPRVAVAASGQTPALGSAMFGAVAAGRRPAATTRSSRRRGAWRISVRPDYRPEPAATRSTTSSTASTSVSTTCSGAAATT